MILPKVKLAMIKLGTKAHSGNRSYTTVAFSSTKASFSAHFIHGRIFGQQMKKATPLPRIVHWIPGSGVASVLRLYSQAVGISQ